MRTLTNKLNERVHKSIEENQQLFLYTILLFISFQSDKIYNIVIAKYYRCSVEYILSCNRNGLIILLSIIFGVIDLFLSYRILKIIYKKPELLISIGIINSLPKVNIRLKRIIMGIVLIILIISVISIVYDFFDVINKFIN